MNKNNEKAQFESTIRREGGSLVATVPPQICEHNDFKEGDTVVWQAEWNNDEDAPYSSNWNGDKHDTDGDDQ